MSILNLTLQEVALVREIISEDMEILFNKANTFEEICKAAEKFLQLASELRNCIVNVQKFLQEKTERLVLHNETFSCYNLVDESEISLFFQVSKFV